MSEATSEEIRQRIADVRRALEALLTAQQQGSVHPSEALRDLARAVDEIRRSVWAVLSALHSGDFPAYLGQVRVARATDACSEVLTELYAAAIPAHTPGLADLGRALGGLVVALDRSRT
jgi:hypothetical protein